MNNVLVGRRKKKSVWLDEGMIELVTIYADKHKINFSRTIEALALLGLQDTKAVGNAWLAFNIAGSSHKSLAARRQQATLALVVELQERIRVLTRIVLALTATELQIPHDADEIEPWNALAEATGIATEKPFVLVEQILAALDDSTQSAAQLRLKTIVKKQLREDPWLESPPATEHLGMDIDSDGAR